MTAYPPPVSPILSMTGHQNVLGQWALDQTIITTYAGVTQPCSSSNPTQLSKAEIVWLEYQQVPFWVHFYVSFTKGQSCFNHLQSSSVSFVCFVFWYPTLVTVSQGSLQKCQMKINAQKRAIKTILDRYITTVLWSKLGGHMIIFFSSQTQLKSKFIWSEHYFMT